MADARSIERVLKRLQLASSSSEGEASNAVRAAVNLMRQEGVTFDDLLRLPSHLLYQKVVLIDVARAWVASLDGLSDYERGRQAEQLVDRIALKWAQEAGAANDEQQRRKDEELRRREEELRRQRDQFRAEQEHQQQQGSDSRDDDRERRRRAYNGEPDPPPSPRSTSFTNRSVAVAGSFLQMAARRPKAFIDLALVSLLFGAACGYALLLLIAFIVRAFGAHIPGDPDISTVWALLTLPFMTWRSLALVNRGWFR